jgi:hypothetical protein
VVELSVPHEMPSHSVPRGDEWIPPAHIRASKVFGERGTQHVSRLLIRIVEWSVTGVFLDRDSFYLVE